MRRTPIVLAALVATAVVIGAGTWVLGGDDDPEPQESAYVATPLSEIDTSTLTVPRAGFCDQVDPRAIEAALGAEPDATSSYQNGDMVALTDDLTDVAHEFGCTWSAADGAALRAWVFAPAVDSRRAKQLVKTAAKTPGCQGETTPAFGAPSIGLVCTGEDQTASYRGLFGDAWLTCEVSVPGESSPPSALRDRAGAWCASVALGASASGAGDGTS